MKVNILVPFLNNFGEKGFYQSQELGLAYAFFNAGIDVTVYKCVKNEIAGIDTPFPVIYKKVNSIGSHALFNPEKLFKDIPDVLICFSDTQLILPSLVKYCKKNTILFIPYVGVTESVEFQKKVQKSLMDFIFNHYVIRAYKNSDFVFCKNYDAKQSLKKSGVKESKLRLIPVGMNLKMLNSQAILEDRNALREKYQISTSDKVLLFVGRLNNEKRPLEMFNILDQLDDNYKLIIIGSGFLKDEVKRRGSAYTNRFLYYEKIPYEKMWEFYSVADYYINLWDREIFGMSILEAIYYLLPTFLISAPGPRVISKTLKNSFVVKEVNEISPLIKEYVYNKSSLLQDREQIVKEFSWDRFVESVVKL